VCGLEGKVSGLTGQLAGVQQLSDKVDALHADMAAIKDLLATLVAKAQ
jgi:hypothetical protein